LEYVGEASSPIAEPQQKKKMKRTKVQKDGKEETNKIVAGSEKVTNKRISKKRLIMDL
jgi:hypothetical protein